MSLPSVLLHDHLDGGLRPQTVLDLAEASGYRGLPEKHVEALDRWFDQSDSGSLETYLQAFEHTIAVMQSPAAIERVAYEAAVDLAEDGVVYAEIRFSPSLHTRRGLSEPEVVEAVASGLGTGEASTGLRWRLIIDAMRHLGDSAGLAGLAIASRPLGVVGFDLAGPEAGHRPERHLAACRMAREAGLGLTLHAGEAAGRDGVAHVAASIDRCGAHRIGHGVELINDCVVDDGEIVELGPVAARVRARRIPLEMCPASNLSTGRLAPEDHPLGALHRAGFNVTLSTDNRLMSSTSMSAEFDFAEKYHGFDIDDLANTTWRSLDAAFCEWETKKELWETVIAPAYSDAGAVVSPVWR
jgi:adenosine deaminase